MHLKSTSHLPPASSSKVLERDNVVARNHIARTSSWSHLIAGGFVSLSLTFSFGIY